MSRDEISELLKEIKVFYPRFENVEKAGGKYLINPTAIDKWFNRLGWMELSRALEILDEHMEAPDGNKTPTINTWLKHGRPNKGDGRITMSFYQQNPWAGVGYWQPDENGKAMKCPATYNDQKRIWEVQVGEEIYDYVTLEDLQQ